MKQLFTLVCFAFVLTTASCERGEIDSTGGTKEGPGQGGASSNEAKKEGQQGNPDRAESPTGDSGISDPTPAKP